MLLLPVVHVIPVLYKCFHECSRTMMSDLVCVSYWYVRRAACCASMNLIMLARLLYKSNLPHAYPFFNIDTRWLRILLVFRRNIMFYFCYIEDIPLFIASNTTAAAVPGTGYALFISLVLIAWLFVCWPSCSRSPSALQCTNYGFWWPGCLLSLIL